MNIIDVMQKAGDRLQTQGLAASMITARKNKKGCQITFSTSDKMYGEVTKQACGVREPKMVGVVCWIPADVFPESGGKEQSS